MRIELTSGCTDIIIFCHYDKVSSVLYEYVNLWWIENVPSTLIKSGDFHELSAISQFSYKMNLSM